MSLCYLLIKAANTSLMNVCNRLPLRFPKMEDLTLLTLHWLPIPGWGREHDPLSLIIKTQNTSKKHNDVPNWIFCDEQYDIWMPPDIADAEHQNRRLELTRLTKPSKTHMLIGTGSGSAYQDSACQVLGWIWKWTELFLQFQPWLLAGYRDRSQTLDIAGYTSTLGQSMCNISSSSIPITGN